MQKMVWILLVINLFSCKENPKASKDKKDIHKSESDSIGAIDNRLYDSLKLANKQHPSKFYMICGSFIQERKMNEASVAYIIGRNRYKLYNYTNPNYEASSDGALAGSFAYMYGDMLNAYLTKNLNNYGHVMQLSGNWYKKNKHFYFENKENDSLYQLQTTVILNFADSLLNHTEEYKQRNLKKQ